MQSKYLAFLAAGLLGPATLASAEDVGHGVDVSANIAFTTDYRYRGVSQTDNDFAIEGGFDVAHVSGLYAGTWAANVDNFNPGPDDSGSQAEVDIYAGYGHNITDELALDFNVLYYYYPGASTAGANDEIDFVEFTPGVSYSTDVASASFGVSYSPEFFNQAGDGFYYNLGVDVPVGASGVTLNFHGGYQTVEKESQYFEDYADWSAGFTIPVFSLDWSVAYVDTDLSESECGSDICDPTVVFTVAKSF